MKHATYGVSVGLAEMLGERDGAAEGRRLGLTLTEGALETLGLELGGELVDGMGVIVGLAVAIFSSISNLGGKSLSAL